MKEFNEDHFEDEERIFGQDPEKQFIPIEEIGDTDNSWQTFGEETPNHLSEDEERELRSAVDKARSLEEEQEIEKLRQEAVDKAEESIKKEESLLKQTQAEHPAETPRELTIEKKSIFRKIFGGGRN